MEDTMRKYARNKYIWENETDKNSAVAKQANAENEAIRQQHGITEDTMNYKEFVSNYVNTSPYYSQASKVSVDPKFKKESDRLYNAINNFTYDASQDPTYQAYSDAAKRESASAQKQTYANLAKMSGGRNSSYASAATAQVGQAYANKTAEYATTLAKEAYDKLVKRYEMSLKRQSQAVDEANSEYKKLMELGDKDVENKRKELDYYYKIDDYQTKLIENGILNEKNMYEFKRWQEDPNYEIKDKELAKAIGEYLGYNWLKNNGTDYFYNKYY